MLSEPDELMVACGGFSLLASGITDTPDGSYLGGMASSRCHAALIQNEAQLSDRRFYNIPPSFVKNAEKYEVVIARHEFAVFRGALQSFIHHNRKAPDVKSAIKQPVRTLKDITIAYSHNNIARQLIEQLPTNTLSEKLYSLYT